MDAGGCVGAILGVDGGSSVVGGGVGGSWLVARAEGGEIACSSRFISAAGGVSSAPSCP